MRPFQFIIPIFIFASCAENIKVEPIQIPPEATRIVSIKLVDSLGNVTISLPERNDTSFSWTHYSDCGKSCNKIKYRSQPKGLQITKESGFLWLWEPKDSIERFTIIHSGYFPFYENDETSFIFNFRQQRKAYVIQDPDTYKIQSDTIEKIGDRNFSIIAIDLFDSTNSQFSKKLLAATSIKSNMIHFEFELLTKEKSSASVKFIENSKYYLRTVRLGNGN